MKKLSFFNVAFSTLLIVCCIAFAACKPDSPIGPQEPEEPEKPEEEPKDAVESMNSMMDNLEKLFGFGDAAEPEAEPEPEPEPEEAFDPLIAEDTKTEPLMYHYKDSDFLITAHKEIAVQFCPFCGSKLAITGKED